MYNYKKETFMDLRLELITSNNFEYALKVQNTIFKEYNARNNYLDSFKNSLLDFYLVYDSNICVGVTGIYAYKDDIDNAWIGFFGILEEYREKGYGKEALRLTEEVAKKENYKYIRVNSLMW